MLLRSILRIPISLQENTALPDLHQSVVYFHLRRKQYKVFQLFYM